MTWFGQMNVPYSWRITDDSVAESRDNDPSPNHGKMAESTHNYYVHVCTCVGYGWYTCICTNLAYYEAFLHYNLTLHIRANHPVKVHVWAGISRQGRTEICIFEGIMDRFLFVDILEKALIPFLERVLPATHRLMQDNDPKHVSHHAQEFF